MSIEASKLVLRGDREFEQIVYAEVMVPNVLNTEYDYSTPEMVRDCANEFARQGFALDVEHDKVDVAGVKMYVVEHFIARPGDPDFIEGSWVMGVKVLDDDLWQQILNNELNGFSIDANIYYRDATFTLGDNRTIIGTTEPDLSDGHTHTYTVIIDGSGHVVAGGTGMTDGHMHPITSHTITAVAEDHMHRYQAVDEDE